VRLKHAIQQTENIPKDQGLDVCYLFFSVTFDFHQFSLCLNTIGLWQNKGLYVLHDFQMF